MARDSRLEISLSQLYIRHVIPKTVSAGLQKIKLVGLSSLVIHFFTEVCSFVGEAERRGNCLDSAELLQVVADFLRELPRKCTQL